MSSTFRSNNERRRDDRFRYGQGFTLQNIDHMILRSPFAYILTYGVIEDALNKGFVLKDPESEKPVDWFDKFKAVYEPMKLDAEKACVFERAHGKSLSILFDDGRDGLMLRVFSRSNYFPEYDDKYKTTMIKANERVGGTRGKTITHTLIQKDLEKTFELIIREGEEKGDGLPVVQPVWDTLYSLRVLDANATRFAVRQAGGLFVARVPASKINDPKYMAKVRAGLAAIDSSMGTITLPIPKQVEGVNVDQTGIDTISTDMIEFDVLYNEFLSSLSAGTRIPKERYIGNEKGMRGAETNDDIYLNLMQDIQRSYTTYFQWLINTLNDKFKWFDPTETITETNEEGKETKIPKIHYTIDFSVRKQMTEEEILELMLLKADLIQKMRGVISDKELEGITGLKLEEIEEIDTEEDDDDEEDEETEE